MRIPLNQRNMYQNIYQTHVVIPGRTALPAKSSTSRAHLPLFLIFSISSGFFVSITHGNNAGLFLGVPSSYENIILQYQ